MISIFSSILFLNKTSKHNISFKYTRLFMNECVCVCESLSDFGYFLHIYIDLQLMV